MKSEDKPVESLRSRSKFRFRPGGYACVVTAALLWACSGTAGKYLFGGGMTPAALVQARVTIAALLLSVVMVGFKRPLLKLRRADIVPLLILGGLITPLLQMTYFLAIKHIQVALALLIQYLAPILVAVFSMLFLKERCTKAKLLALVLSLGGCYLALGGSGLTFAGVDRWGIFWGLCSAFLYAAYTLLSERQMQGISPWTVLFYSLMLAALSLNLALGPFIFVASGRSLNDWLIIAFVAIFGTLIPFGLFYLGISRIRATRAIITAMLEPVFAAGLAFVLIGERLSPLQIAGGALVIAAIVLLQIKREQPESSPSAAEPQEDTRNSLIGTPE